MVWNLDLVIEGLTEAQMDALMTMITCAVGQFDGTLAGGFHPFVDVEESQDEQEGRPESSEDGA